MKIRKIEWHQVSSYYEAELDEDLLAEIYPDRDEDEINELYAQILAGDVDVETVLDDAGWDVEVEWDHQDDDWWTHRKGGFDVTYEVLGETETDEQDTDEEEDIIAGLDQLSAAFDSLSEEEKEALRAEFSSDDRECSICVWSGPESDTITGVDGKQCCPECHEPVILNDSDSKE